MEGLQGTEGGYSRSMTVLSLAAAVVSAIIANVIVYALLTGPLDQALLMPERSPPP